MENRISPFLVSSLCIGIAVLYIPILVLIGYSFNASALVSVFVTALYTFRMMFMTFHGEERFRAHGADHGHAAAGAHDSGEGHGGTPSESPWVVTLPLVLLAVPSVYAGWAYIQPLLFGGFFGRPAEAND